MPDAALWILALLLVLAGIAGAVLPVIPGAPLVFGGLLLAAFVDHFEKVGWFPLVVIGFLMVLTFVVDVVATSLGAKKAGASPLALVGAGVGTVAGLFFGFVGVIVGPFAGTRIWYTVQTVSAFAVPSAALIPMTFPSTRTSTPLEADATSGRGEYAHVNR